MVEPKGKEEGFCIHVQSLIYIENCQYRIVGHFQAISGEMSNA